MELCVCSCAFAESPKPKLYVIYFQETESEKHMRQIVERENERIQVDLKRATKEAEDAQSQVSRRNSAIIFTFQLSLCT